MDDFMKCFNTKKGDLWISAALYVVITVVIITIVLSAGIPMLDNMRDKNAFEDSKKSLLILDEHITEVANEGPGSQRIIPIEIKKGTLSLNDEGVTWSMKTKANIIDPRTKIKTGNLIVSSNIDVKAYEENNSCIMENSKIRIKILKLGSLQNYTGIDTSGLITEFKDIRTGSVADGNFSFLIGDVSTSNSGFGYTTCDRLGSDLDYSSVTLYMFNTTGSTSFDYELEFILDSEGDFVKTKVSNVRIH
jgi:hypothetical protein